MKKLVSVIGATFLAATVFALTVPPISSDSCGSLEQWKIPPVKGKCPYITNQVMVEGTMYCVVKCSYLEQEAAKKEKRKARKEGKNK